MRLIVLYILGSCVLHVLIFGVYGCLLCVRGFFDSGYLVCCVYVCLCFAGSCCLFIVVFFCGGLVLVSFCDDLFGVSMLSDLV